MKTPCKGCKSRAVGCHGECEEYEQYKTDLAAAKAQIYGGNPEHVQMFREVGSRRYKRIRKAQHLKEVAK